MSHSERCITLKLCEDSISSNKKYPNNISSYQVKNMLKTVHVNQKQPKSVQILEKYIEMFQSKTCVKIDLTKENYKLTTWYQVFKTFTTKHLILNKNK